MASITMSPGGVSSKRLAAIGSFLLFIALCASLAYWALQLFKPPARQVAAPPVAAAAPVDMDAAASLFSHGGAGNSAGGPRSNYQLKGVVLAGNPKNSVVILASDDKPAKAYPANRDIAPGVTIKEVHPGYVLLSENGVQKKLELPAELKPSGVVDNRNTAPPVRGPNARTGAAAGSGTAATPPPRTMPNVPSAPPTAGSAAGNVRPGGAAGPQGQPAQQQLPQPVQQQVQPQQPQQVPPGMPVPANQAPGGTASSATSGASGTAGVTAGGGVAPNGGVAAGGVAAGGVAPGGVAPGGVAPSGAVAPSPQQQPVYVQSPPAMSGGAPAPAAPATR